MWQGFGWPFRAAELGLSRRRTGRPAPGAGRQADLNVHHRLPEKFHSSTRPVAIT
jgi:hypothetical protein